MEHLYTPWRSGYISGVRPTKQIRSRKKTCFFCNHIESKKDATNLVLSREAHSLIIMNLYPYNDGHLMIVPYRHVGRPDLLSEEEWQDLHEASRKAILILEEVLHTEGFNIGMNLGKVAGAGLDQHLHLHVVPRWPGDTNFMPVIGHTKTMNQDLKALYKKLRSRFAPR